MYPELINSVKLCVMSIADLCFGVGLISQYTYDQLIERVDWINTDKARILLSSIRTALSTKLTALKEFVSVLFESGECNDVAKKIQHQL